MEAVIADLSSRLQEFPLHSRPGLTSPHGPDMVQPSLEERVDLLEQVFVLVDWQAPEIAARPSKQADPDSELSPDSRSLDQIAESDKNLTNLPDLPPFPVAAPLPTSSP